MNAEQPGDDLILTIGIDSDQDIFAVRRFGRAAARGAGLDDLDQVRLATALSELGRDLLRPAPMTAVFTLSGPDHGVLVVELRWTDGRVPSAEALAATARLLPQAAYLPGDPDGGGRVVIERALPSGAAKHERVDLVREALAAVSVTSREDELRAQTRDLVAALEDSRTRGEELERLNLELAETNRGVVALYTELSQELDETNSGVVALYAELEEKSRLLREAGESRTRLWSNVSHELRTPLNSVVGLCRLLLDPQSDLLTADQNRQVSLVAAAGTTLLALVDELLDVAKAEAGRMRPHLAPVDLRALLGHLHGLMLGTAPSSGVELVMPEPDSLPDLVTDETLLTRILRNLLSNGLKFTRHGTVRLDVGRDETDEWVFFQVSDTGVGIPLDQQAHVFEEFYQVPGVHQRNRPGTGLGLPYARRLAELLDGTLTLESVPEHGTCVTLRLPATTEAPPTPPRMAKMVSVDDDVDFHDLCRAELAQVADLVIEVADSMEAVETIARERPDAVLVDLHMPGMDGYTVIAELAADPELCRIPVVVVTAADPSTVDSSRLGHAKAVLEKAGLTARRLGAALFSDDPDRANSVDDVTGTRATNKENDTSDVGNRAGGRP